MKYGIDNPAAMYSSGITMAQTSGARSHSHHAIGLSSAPYRTMGIRNRTAPTPPIAQDQRPANRRVRCIAILAVVLTPTAVLGVSSSSSYFAICRPAFSKTWSKDVRGEFEMPNQNS
jgi:hypothetical protein